jgi:hypothetical protein
VSFSILEYIDIVNFKGYLVLVDTFRRMIFMYENKGIITEEEQALISRYPEDLQERLKEKL